MLFCNHKAYVCVFCRLPSTFAVLQAITCMMKDMLWCDCEGADTVVQGPACQTAQDTRAALVLLLIARCNMEQIALQQAGGEALFATLLKDADARVRYHASMFVQQRLVATKADQYRRALRQLTQQAQQVNDDKLLRNPYLQISAMLDMRLIDLSV